MIHTNKTEMMKKILCMSCAALPLLAAAQSGRFVIDGKMMPDTLATGKIYLAYNDNGEEMRDSSAIVNNTYHFEGTMADGAIQANLFWEDRTKPRQSGYKGHAQFYVVPGRVKVVNKARFTEFAVAGSPVEEQARSIAEAIRKNRNAEKDIQLDYIRNHPDSWLSFIYLDLRMNRARDITYDQVDTLYAGLGEGLKKYDRVKAIKTVIDQSRLAVVGKQAIDFVANDVNGKPVSLSSYRGKYLFLDFWASWCHPCRDENPTVTAAYHKFKDKGLNILSVSLDGNRDAWLKAVAQDKLEWTQVSNLKAFKDEVAVKYAITSIPTNFLIDPDGKIIARNLRGPALEKKLAEVFN